MAGTVYFEDNEDTATGFGDNPLKLSVVKSALKVTSNVDDEYITLLMDSALFFGEEYTNRAFRVNYWVVFNDTFEGLCITKAQITTNNIIQKLIYFPTAGGSVIIDEADYSIDLNDVGWGTLKESNLTGFVWPTDINGIELRFRTWYPKAIQARSQTAMLKHITYLYQNRGDCGADDDSVKASGASLIYGQFRIPRI